MTAIISSIGDAHGDAIDPAILQDAQLKPGDAVDISLVEDGAITTPLAPEAVSGLIGTSMSDYAETLQRLA